MSEKLGIEITSGFRVYKQVADIDTRYGAWATLDHVKTTLGSDRREIGLTVGVNGASVTVTNSGTTTATVANKLTDTGGTPNFTSTVTVGDIVNNTTDGSFAKVLVIDSDSVLTLDANIIPTAKAYIIYTPSTVTEYWWRDGILDGELVAKGSTALVLTDGQGTTANSTTMDLGGTVTADVVIDTHTNAKSLTIGSITVGGVVINNTLSGSEYSLLSGQNSSGVITFQVGGSTGALLTDLRVTKKGIEYAVAITGADFTSESLPHWGFVQTKIGAQAINTLVTTPTNAQHGFVIGWNKTNTEYELISNAAGITNGAAADELTKSDGTNIVGTKVFSGTDGSIELGDSGLAGHRTILVASSAANADLTFSAKSATGIVKILNSTNTGQHRLWVGDGVSGSYGRLEVYGNSASEVITKINNTGGNAALKITAAGNDPYVSFGINFNTYSLGIDTTDTHLKINYGADPSTGTNLVTITSGGNIGINGASFADMVKGLFIGGATTNPTTNPTGGGLFYSNISDDSKPYWRTPSGNVYDLTSGSGGGITNVGATDELVKSNGVNVIGTSIYSPIDGSLIFGDVGDAGDRNISIVSSTTNSSFIFTPQGTGTLKVPSGYSSNITSNDDIINKEYGDATYMGGVWVGSLTTGDVSAVQNAATADISGQTGSKTYTFLEVDITKGARSSSGAVKFIDFKSDGNNVFHVESRNGTAHVDIGNHGNEDQGIDINGTVYETALRVNDYGAVNEAQFIVHRHSTTLAPVIIGARSNSNDTTHAAVTTGQSVLGMYGAGYTGSHYDLFGSIDFEVDTGTVSGTSSPGRIVFKTTPDGSNVPVTALTINNEGKTVSKTGLTGGYWFGAGTEGIYSNAATSIAVVLGGSTRYYIDNSAIWSNSSSGWYLKRSGTGPNYSFVGDNTTGLRRIGAGNIALVTGGIDAFAINASQNSTFYGSVTTTAGAALTPIIIGSHTDDPTGGVAGGVYFNSTSNVFKGHNGGGWLPFIGDSTTISALRITGSTFSTVQHIQDAFHSSGTTEGGDIINDGDGTITVELGTGLIRAIDSNVAPIYFTDWSAESGANVALVDNDLNHLYVEYNAGAPRIIATTIKRVDYNTNIGLGTVYRNGTLLHITPESHINISDHAGAMIRRMHDISPFAHKEGAKISEKGVRNIGVTQGAFWHGLNLYTTAAFDSSIADTFDLYYRDGGGGWTRVVSTQINNTQFDNGTGALGTLSNNNYGVHWVFMESDGEISVALGQDSYSLSNAENANVPAGLPPEFEGHARIIGKIIIKKSEATFTSIESAFDNIFRSAIPTSHLDLLNIGTNTHDQIDDYIANVGGDVSKVGTPVDNQIGVWTGDGTIEGTANFKWDDAGTELLVNGNVVLNGSQTIEFGTTKQLSIGFNGTNGVYNITTGAHLFEFGGAIKMMINTTGVELRSDFKVGVAGGIKFGTATTEKFAFWNATPIVQPVHIADATDAATAISQLNLLLAQFATLGLQASS